MAKKKQAVLPLLTREARIKRQLRRHLRALGFSRDCEGALSLPALSKTAIREMHFAHRRERLLGTAAFVKRTWPTLGQYFANGEDLQPEAISCRLELIKSDTWQSDLFRLATLTWSVPVSSGYGRRLRYLVWDEFNNKLVGLFALGDPVFNIKVRDDWIGWSTEQRKRRLVNVMDAYVLGSVPPYNMLLGGKLVACLTNSREVRLAFSAKYGESTGIISKTCRFPSLCLVTTTSSLGRSSLYNRLKLDGRLFFRPLGYTSGWGHFHIPDSLFASMRAYLEGLGHDYASAHQFGDGPSWRLRVVRQTLQELGLRPDLLRHGIAREVFASTVADNAIAVLRGEEVAPQYTLDATALEISIRARQRWIVPRSGRQHAYRSWLREGILALLKRNTRPEGLNSGASGQVGEVR